MYKEELIRIETKDFEKIAIWKIFDDEILNNKNIFISHGTFSNKKICLGIAKYFAALGYTSWIMEWRNHGKSATTKQKFNFETIALYDIEATFRYLFETLKINTIDCITHSGGGIALSIYLIKNKTYIQKINSISMFCCQSFGACYNSKNKFKIFFSKILGIILNHIPAKTIGLGPENETYYTMKQWFDWNLKKNFKGLNNIDYQAGLKDIKIPILSLSGGGDHFIAPKEGVLQYLNAFENPKNIFINCSISNGYSEDYNHSKILFSKNASLELWPIVRNWIENTNSDFDNLKNIYL